MIDPEIDHFLDELRQALDGLRGGERRRALREARDHLLCATAEGESRGVPRAEAAQRAVDSFGRAETIAASYESVPRTRLLRIAAPGLAVIAAAIAALVVAPSGSVPPARATSSASWLDVSYSDAQHAWALVSRTCPSGDGPCAVFQKTSDGGRTWQPAATFPGGSVTGLERVDGKRGIVFGKTTSVTADGGRTWVRVPGKLTESATVADGALYALGYSHSGCPAACDVTLRRADAGSRTFVDVPGFRNPTLGDGDELVGSGQNLYAIGYGHPAGGAGTAYSRLSISRDAGWTWTPRIDPCRKPGAAEIDSGPIAAAGRYVALLCISRFGGKTSSIVLSGDAGRTFTRIAVPFANANEVALDAAGNLAIANGVIAGSGTYTYRVAVSNNRGGKWQSMSWHIIYDKRAPVGAAQPPPVLRIFGQSLRWVIDGQAMLRSEDGGRTWQATTAH